MKIKTVQNSQRSNSQPRHAVMTPPCKTSHTFLMTSMQPGCQYKIRKKNTRRILQVRTVQLVEEEDEEFYETGKVRAPSISGEVSTTQSECQNDNPKKTEKSSDDQREQQSSAGLKKLQICVPPFIAHSPSTPTIQCLHENI